VAGTIDRETLGSSATVRARATSADGSAAEASFDIAIVPEPVVLRVRAAGTGDASVAPLFRVFADGALVDTLEISTPGTTAQRRDGSLVFDTFEFAFATGERPSDVVIEFFNDGTSPSGQGRDLVIDRIEIDGQRFEAEVDGLYVRTRPSGDVVIGPTQTMLWNGTMTFTDLDV